MSSSGNAYAESKTGDSLFVKPLSWIPVFLPPLLVLLILQVPPELLSPLAMRALAEPARLATAISVLLFCLFESRDYPFRLSAAALLCFSLGAGTDAGLTGGLLTVALSFAATGAVLKINQITALLFPSRSPRPFQMSTLRELLTILVVFDFHLFFLPIVFPFVSAPPFPLSAFGLQFVPGQALGLYSAGLFLPVLLLGLVQFFSRRNSTS